MPDPEAPVTYAGLQELISGLETRFQDTLRQEFGAVRDGVDREFAATRQELATIRDDVGVVRDGVERESANTRQELGTIRDGVDREFASLRHEIGVLKAALEERMGREFEKAEARMSEMMGAVETNILRSVAGITEQGDLRLKRVEASESTLAERLRKLEATDRLLNLELRILEIEKRLGIPRQ